MRPKAVKGIKGKKKSSGPSEEMKAKFREALDKKHAHAGMDVSADGDAPKVERGARTCEGAADVPPQGRQLTGHQATHRRLRSDTRGDPD